jgi:hypothetical protein
MTLWGRAARRIQSFPDPHLGLPTAEVASLLYRQIEAVASGELVPGVDATFEVPAV